MKDYVFFTIFYNYGRRPEIFGALATFFQQNCETEEEYYLFLNRKRGRSIGITFLSEHRKETIKERFLSFIEEYLSNNASPAYQVDIASNSLYFNYYNNSVELSLFNLGIPYGILFPSKEISLSINRFSKRMMSFFAERSSLNESDSVEAYIHSVIHLFASRENCTKDLKQQINGFFATKYLDFEFGPGYEELYQENKSLLDEVFLSLGSFSDSENRSSPSDFQKNNQVIEQFSVRLGITRTEKTVADYLMLKHSRCCINI